MTAYNPLPGASWTDAGAPGKTGARSPGLGPPLSVDCTWGRPLVGCVTSL